MTIPLSIKMLFPVPCVNGGVAHTALATCRHLNGDGATAQMFTTRADQISRSTFVHPVVPPILDAIPYRFLRRHAARRCERVFLSSISPSDAAYLWSTVSRGCLMELRKRGVPTIREKFNCHRATARRILAAEYDRIGMPWEYCVMSEADVQRECEDLQLVDFVSSPSPPVTRSMVDAGIRRDRIIETSYGWCPDRFQPPPDRPPSPGPLTVAFVGALCVRKGGHLLLDAWQQARIPGRLVLCGRIEPALKMRYQAVLNRGDVVVTGLQSNIANVYRAADFQVFPTLEEGSPLVTYEALAHGLPLVTSPMGAGSVVRDGVDGIVIGTTEIDQLVQAIRRMAGDQEFRMQCSRSSQTRAQRFTWKRVGARKRALFSEAIATLQGIATGASATLGQAA